jgi:hypothetical protein
MSSYSFSHIEQVLCTLEIAAFPFIISFKAIRQMLNSLLATVLRLQTEAIGEFASTGYNPFIASISGMKLRSPIRTTYSK